MYTKPYGAWFRAGLDAWMLGAEASAVIGMRMAKLATGGGAGMAEATLMLSEKVKAGLELQARMIGQGASLTPLSSTQQALRHYRGKVAANKRRLTR